MLAGMTATMPPQEGLIAANAATTETIETRFGRVTVNTAAAVFFPSGMLGLPDKAQFCLTEFPSEKLRQQFKLLQCLDDTELSFITLPLELMNPIIREQHIREAAAELEIPVQDLVVLVVVSVHRSPMQVRLSVNARAPLFIDAARKLGAQYVFTHDTYAVQHMITS